MLTLYTNPQSRGRIARWMLEEIGQPYDTVVLDYHTSMKAPEYLAINPMGKVPALVDGDFVLTESVAINAWLAARQPTPLLPPDLETRARIDQWTSWAITEVEFHFTVMVRELRRAGAAGEAPDADLVAAALANVSATLAVLERHLAAGHAFVAGADFTLGDINAAFPVALIAQRLDMQPFPQITAWLDRCTSRPAWQKVMARDESDLPSI